MFNLVFLSHMLAHTHTTVANLFWGGCRLRVKTTVPAISANTFIQIVSYLAAFVSSLANVSDLCYHTVGVEKNNEKAHNHTHTNIHHALMHTHCHNVVGFEKLTFTLLNTCNTELLIFFFLLFLFSFFFLYRTGVQRNFAILFSF